MKLILLFLGVAASNALSMPPKNDGKSFYIGVKPTKPTKKPIIMDGMRTAPKPKTTKPMIGIFPIADGGNLWTKPQPKTI